MTIVCARNAFLSIGRDPLQPATLPPIAVSSQPVEPERENGTGSMSMPTGAALSGTSSENGWSGSSRRNGGRLNGTYLTTWMTSLAKRGREVGPGSALSVPC